jgi:hypothetical protein
MSRFQGLEGLPPDRLAPLNAHNKYQDVDRLYDPLREISSPAHQQRVNGGMARGSKVSSQVHQLSQQEMNALVRSFSNGREARRLFLLRIG